MNRQILGTLKEVNREESRGNRLFDGPSSRASVASVLSQAAKKTKHDILELENELAQLQLDHEDQVAPIEDELEEVMGFLQTTEDEEERQALEASKLGLTTKLERLHRRYDQKRVLKEGIIQRKRQMLVIEEDDDQRLDPVDEDQVHNYDRANPSIHERPDAHNQVPPVINPPPHQEHEHTVIPETVTVPVQPFGSQASHPSTASSNESLIKDLTTAISQAVGKRGSNFEKKLPEFDGNPGIWGKFSAMFWKSTQDFSMSNTENIMRLEGALKGRAKSTVEHLMYNAENVPIIMRNLGETFGRPEHVINYLMEKAKACRPPAPTDPDSIVQFGIAIEALVVNIDSFGRQDYWYNTQIVTELVVKMPDVMQTEWCKWQIENPAKLPNILAFSEWMAMQRRIAQLRVKPSFGSDDKKKIDNRPQKAFHATVKSDGKIKCFKCGLSSHQVGDCNSFLKLNCKKRKEFARDNRLCFRCLRGRHLAADCKNPKRCDAEGCREPNTHHPSLHFDSNVKEVQEETVEVPRSIQTILARLNILPIVPCVARGPKGKEKVYVLFDTAASFCMMEDGLAERIGAEGEIVPLEYDVFQDQRTEYNSRCVSFEISGDFDRAPFYVIKKAHTVKRMDLAPRSFDAEAKKKAFPHLKNMRVKSIINGRPTIVLGINNGGLFAARQILERAPGEAPAAVKSLLGWYLIENEETAGKHFQFMSLEEQMHQQIKEFVLMENLGVTPLPSNRSIEDEQALKILDEKSEKINGKWKTSLLWRNLDQKLPESKSMAVQRLSSMQRKMNKNPEFASLCHEKFQEYIAKGFLKKVENGLLLNEVKIWYLPWFFSYHPTKKPRLVFDAAAKSSGKSFNDFLLTGPDFLRPLFAVLLRFRRHKIAISADIQQMFHQVELTEEDWSAQRILYTPEGEDEPGEYVMTVLFFGAASSPSTALYIKDRNANEFKEEYPVAVQAIRKDFYMDDFLSGGESDKEALRLQKQVTQIHQDGGFPLVKWNSSSPTVLQSISSEIRATDGPKLASKDEVEWEKTLGLLWSPETDEFSFKLSKEKIPEDIWSGKKVPTKRMITRVVMSVFDPLGFLCILKMGGMLIIQNTWKCGVGWDDEVPDSIFEEWKTWLLEIQTVTKLRIPRRISTVSISEWKNVQLHVFSDASEVAYASAAYLRIDTGGRITTSFLMGKTRVGPVKGMSIPKMELNAALLGARIAASIKEAFDDDVKIDKTYFWSDSETVLSWIRSTDKRHPIYVASRVGEILKLTDSADWKWVPSADNVADDATKIKKIVVTEDSRWFHGPSFLLLPPEEWPVKMQQSLFEQQSIQVCVKKEEPPYLPNAEEFSSWYRLLRATAARFLAVRKWKAYKRSKKIKCLKSFDNFITIEDMRKPEVMWIKHHQQEYFMDELTDLQRKGEVNRESCIKSYSPILNTEGVIVMEGRLENAQVDETIKRPPILNSKGRYVELLVNCFHHTSQHYGQERIVNEIRKKAWILHVRSVVKKCKSECILCKIAVARGLAPQIGQLPFGRVEEGQKPFYNTGVDYFGPLYVKVKRSHEKRWGVIFTCLATRAVHLELAESLTTSNMINALVRFSNLRGNPCHIWSDNGTNFVGAQREILEGIRKWNEEKIQDAVLKRNMEWHFIPPASPHMGGAWERLIRDVKRILTNMLKENFPSEPTLRTVFTEITSILNSRPLTVVSSDPDDMQCLTPNDLLNVGVLVGPTVPGTPEWDSSIRDSWKRTQVLAEQFWKRWSVEYLPWLTRSRKWNKKTRPLQVGDVVLMLEDNSPRNDWKKGIVDKIYPCKNGQVRVVDVRVARTDPDNPKVVKVTTFKRPAVKICPLIPND